MADPRGEGRRGGADAPDLTSGVEVVRAVQGHVLGRLLADDEERQPELGRVLFSGAATDPLDAAVVRDVPALLADDLEDLTAFDLPALRDVLDVVQTFPDQLVLDRCHLHSPFRTLGVRAWLYSARVTHASTRRYRRPPELGGD